MKRIEINGKLIEIKIHEFEGKLSIEEYERQVYSSLNKIGISKDYITINYLNDSVQIIWKINNLNYEFYCNSQKTKTQNIGAIAQALQEDIRQISRGIKDIFQIMMQYEKKDLKISKKTNLLDYNLKNQNLENDNIKSNNIDNIFKFEANTIENLSNKILDSKYYYLQNYDLDKLDKIYFKLKEQCIKNNKPEHEMFIALKIIRNKRGLKL